MENIAVVAQSVGSVLAATWVHDYAPPIRCMVLAAPAFRIKLYVPFARMALSVAARVKPDLHVKSYVKPTALTHDKERVESYLRDPLITRPISVRVLLGLYSASRRVIRDAQAIRVPVQLLISGSDLVVRKRPQHDFFERLGSPVKEKHIFEGFYHDTLGERDRHLAIWKVRAFLTKSFASPETADACDDGFTQAEFAALSWPLPSLSVRRWNFGISRFCLRTAGRLSGGIPSWDAGPVLIPVVLLGLRVQEPAWRIWLPVGRLIDWVLPSIRSAGEVSGFARRILSAL